MPQEKVIHRKADGRTEKTGVSGNAIHLLQKQTYAEISFHILELLFMQPIILNIF